MDDEVAALVVDNGSGMCKVSDHREIFGIIAKFCGKIFERNF